MAIPAVFFSTVVGKRPPSPVISLITMPGVDFFCNTTSSPGRFTANPKISNPQATLATVAGAYTRIFSILREMATDGYNICKNT